MEQQLRTRKISLSTTPAGLHEKKAERSIQTVKKRLAATKAALSYVLPSVLEAEAYITVIRLCNVVPTLNTGYKTPYEIFHNEKPQLPAYAFGTIAVCYHPRSEDKSLRAEIEIFLSHGYNLRYLKVWIPPRHQVYSIRHIKPLKNQVTPPSWNYPQNLRGVKPVQRAITDSDHYPTKETVEPTVVNSRPVPHPLVSPGRTYQQQGIDRQAPSTPLHANLRHSMNSSSLHHEAAPQLEPAIDQEGDVVPRQAPKELLSTPVVISPGAPPTLSPETICSICITRQDEPTLGTTTPLPRDNHSPSNNQFGIPPSITTSMAPNTSTRSENSHPTVITRSGRAVKPNPKYINSISSMLNHTRPT
jgi:hypothetical protein